MAIFTVYGIKAVATGAGLGPLSVEAGATARRGKLLQFSVGVTDAPTNHAVTIRIQRYNATGTGTAIASTAFGMMDPGDVAANVSAVAKQTLTVSPTLLANNALLFQRMFNTQYGFDYYPPPGGEIVYPATAASGIVWDTPIAPVLGDNLGLLAEIQEA